MPDSSTSSTWGTSGGIAFQLWDLTTGSPLSQSSAGGSGSASFASPPTVSASNGLKCFVVWPRPDGFGSQAADRLSFLVPETVPLNTGSAVLTFSKLSIDLGSGILAGHKIGVQITISFGLLPNGSNKSRIEVGTTAAFAASASPVATGPASANVRLGTLAFKDAVGGGVHSGDEVDLTLSGAAITLPAKLGEPARAGLMWRAARGGNFADALAAGPASLGGIGALSPAGPLGVRRDCACGVRELRWFG